MFCFLIRISQLQRNPKIKPITGRFIEHINAWKSGLIGFPRYDYIILGILKGFRIGINDILTKYPNLIANDPYKLHLSNEEREAVGNWLIKGCLKGYISGSFTKNFKFPWKLYCAPIFVRPKPVGWRPIVHLSHNMNGLVYSVNDLLCEYMKTVKYISFREVVNMVNHAGKGAYIFLIDAQDAYYRVPIHPDDWKFNGLFWDNFYWVFTSLQMGLSSSPRIYTLFQMQLNTYVVRNIQICDSINECKCCVIILMTFLQY